MILEFMPYQACYPILKLVYSATTNANHNMCSNEAISIISKVEVNKGKHCEKIKTSSSVMGTRLSNKKTHLSYNYYTERLKHREGIFV